MSYNVTWRIVTYITAGPMLLMSSLWPAYAEANTRGDITWMRFAYARSRRLTLVILTVGCIGLLVAGKRIIRVWAGPPAVPTTGLLCLMCLWMFIFAVAMYQSCLMGAVNRVKRQAISGIIAAATNLALSILWVRRYGPAGVLLATIVSYLLFVVAVQTVEVRRILRGDFLSDALQRS